MPLPSESFDTVLMTPVCAPFPMDMLPYRKYVACQSRREAWCFASTVRRLMNLSLGKARINPDGRRLLGLI